MKLSLALDSTQIVQFLQCPQQWYWSNVRNLTHVFQKREAMDRGTVFHGLLERYYTALVKGATWGDAQQFAFAGMKADRAKLNLAQPDWELLAIRFTQYCVSYMNNDFVPESLEQGFTVPIVDDDLFLFVLEGRVDFIGHDQKGTKLFMDHKTQDRKHELYAESVQFKNYAFATNISTCVINYVRLGKEVGADTFARASMYFSPFRRNEWLETLKQIFFRVAHAIATQQFDRNWSFCQNTGYGYPCQFTKLCEQPSKQIQEALIQIHYQQKEEWQPWRIGEK